MSDGPARRFEFEVTATATVSIEAQHAGQARDSLFLRLDGADATVATGPGAGLGLTRLRVSDDARLLRVDGADPVADLAEALRAFGRGSEGN